MFTETQIKALQAPLDGQHVKQRQQAGRTFSYVEGWHVIAEANRIFGHGNWSRYTEEMRQVREPEQIEGKWRVAYIAKSAIYVWGDGVPADVPASPGTWSSTRTTTSPITREGWGYGSGIAKDIGDAVESAIKEAETDAMKRAFMTFGNPFGLALYDKEQREVTHAEAKPEPESPSERPTTGDARADAIKDGWRRWWKGLKSDAEQVKDQAGLENLAKQHGPQFKQFADEWNDAYQKAMTWWDARHSKLAAFNDEIPF